LIENASCGKKSKAQKGIGRLVIPHLRPVTAFAVKVACFFQVQFCSTKRHGQAMAVDIIALIYRELHKNISFSKYVA
jgi:hypothetical protein